MSKGTQREHHPSLERVRELLDYDPLSGIFRAEVKRSQVAAADIVGCPDANPYRRPFQSENEPALNRPSRRPDPRRTTPRQAQTRGLARSRKSETYETHFCRRRVGAHPRRAGPRARSPPWKWMSKTPTG